MTALEPAAPSDAALLANLLELYIHDLSEVFPVRLGPDGRYGYPHLGRYWSEPEHRFPFLIRSDGAIAGFALVSYGASGTDPVEWDVAEFFVLRRYRRAGVGRRAALLLWNRFPGPWTVRVAEGNRGGLEFWGRVVTEFTGGEFVRSRRPGETTSWQVFSFASPGSTADILEP